MENKKKETTEECVKRIVDPIFDKVLNSANEVKKVEVISDKKVTNHSILAKSLKKKDIELIKILKNNPEGLRVTTLMKLSSLKSKTLYNHLNRLLNLKLVENLYPIWKLCKNQALSKILQSPQMNNNIQGHKFSFVLPLIKKPDWWDKRRDRLIKLKDWQYKKDITFGNNTYEEIFKDHMQIQTFKNSIYFINQREYWNNDPFLAWNEAKEDVLEAIRFIEEKFRFKFIASGNEHLTCISPHLVNVQDALSKHCKKTNNRFLIKTPEGYRLYVDFSEPFGTESNNPEVMRLYLRDLKDKISHPEVPVTSEMWQIQVETSQKLKETADLVNRSQNQINGLIQVAESRKEADIMLMKNQELHFDLLRGIKRELNGLSKAIKSVKEENTRLRLGSQKTLGDFKC